MKIKLAATKEDFINCWDVVKELRQDLTLDEFLTLLPEMEKQGYQLIFIEENGKPASFCGYRYQTMLHRGPSIYIDDLCTLPEARGKGFAAALLAYVLGEAKKKGLQSVHLDSGHQRFDAHRLYLNKGFQITSHHFALKL